MKIHAKVQNKDIVFSSDLAKRAFLEKNEGKYLSIELDETTTSEMRRYFEGCLVPVTYYTHPHSGYKTFRDAREALKLEFLPSRQISSLAGKFTARSVPSTSDLSKEQFKNFVESIVRWLVENQLCSANDIDSQAYVAWRDSAPAAGEIYPPLKRLKAVYDKEVAKAFPWRLNEKNTPAKKEQNTISQSEGPTLEFL